MDFTYPFPQLGRLYLDPEIREAILSLYEQLEIGESNNVLGKYLSDAGAM